MSLTVIVIFKEAEIPKAIWVKTILATAPMSVRQTVKQSYSIRTKRDRALGIVSRLHITTDPGFIYIMRRSDGIYKIGRTTNTNHRLSQHATDYGMDFELVKRFVVPDAIEFEKLALSMTANYRHLEDNRLELRRMPKRQVNEFVSEFTKICEVSISL
jgi:predicted GIY-YIG superfamily endonuclease